MYKSPRSENDDSLDFTEVSYPPRTRKATGGSTEGVRTTATASSRKQPPKRYSADAPIARRASLVRERQEQQRQAEEREQQRLLQKQKARKAGTSTTRRKGVEAPSQDEAQLTQPPRRQASRPSQPTRPVQAGQPRARSAGTAYKKPASRPESSKIPAQAPRAFQPSRPATVSPRRRAGTATRSTQTWRERPQPLFTRKRIATGTGVTVLLLLLLVPLLLRASHFGAPSGGEIITSDGTQITGIGAQPNPNHNLIIKPQDLDHPVPPVLAASAYLLDANSGDTLYAYNAFAHLPMLSTTKLMMAILAIEQQGGNLDQRITINAAMSSDISKLSPDSALFGIKKGEIYTLRDLLYGLLFVSGNDAAIAIADALGGTMQQFVNEMNVKAQQLGMLDTHFANPHGLLQNGQYSCAHDLALLGRFAMTIPTLHSISGEKAYYIPAGGNHPQRYLLNENQFLWWYPGVDGGKTGYDGASDFIQVMSVTRNNHHLIGVVMDTNNWWTDMRDLMNWGFDSFTWVSPAVVDAQHPIPYDSLWNYFAKDTINTTIPAANKGRYYVYTGYEINWPIMIYFDTHGGLKSFGYPISQAKTPDPTHITQQFQKASIQCSLPKPVCQKM